jgi:peptidyl-prolyl cis-trans isomerase D
MGTEFFPAHATGVEGPMLDNLRANKGGIITYVFLFAIIVVFVVSFGPGSFDKGCSGAQGPAWAARVNGETVSVAEYERAYGNLLRSFQQQAGQGFSRELAEQLGLSKIALEQVVDRALVVAEARRQGLAISDDELARTILEIPGFQADGKFDREGYQRAVASAYGSESRFETVLREDLLYQRMLAGLRETVKVSDGEVQAAWSSEHDQASITFVRFPLAGARLEVKRPAAAEVSAFAATAGPRIEKFWKENPARFDQPKKVKARHLLVKVAPGGDEAAARARIEALAARIQKGEDFAKVAAQSSDDQNTKGRGGDLGFITEALVEKPFAEAAMALAPGQVSAPVRTGAGFHLIRVDEVVAARQIPLEAARPELAAELLVEDRAAALLQARSTQALAALQGGQSLAALFPSEASGKKVVKLGGLVVAADSTGLFGAEAAYLPKLGNVPGLAAAALAGTVGKPLPTTYASAQGPVVAVVEKRLQPDTSRFETQKADVAARLRNRRESQVQGAWLKQLREAAKVEVNPALAAGPVPPEAG